MPKHTIEYRCLLISPSDVSNERAALTELVNYWNAQIGRGLDARVELVRWESHATPDMSGAPQNIINEQLLESCDMGIAIFWSKLGTPTEEYDSGSVEEISRLVQRGARVMVYFSSQPIPQEALRGDQYSRLQEVRNKFKNEGLLATYADVAHLREQVNLHLTNVITQLLSKDRNVTSYIPTSGTLTAPTPDVRVTASSCFSQSLPETPLIHSLAIQVRNYSPAVVHLQTVRIETEDGGIIVPNGDFINNEYQKFRELQPGRSFMIRVDPAEIKKHMNHNPVRASVIDDIGRIYRSDPDELKRAIKTVFDNLGMS